MDGGHIIYCVSNASVDYFKNNKLTEFTNFLPVNFGIDKPGWEIGVAAFGLHLNTEKDSEKNIIQIKSDVAPSFNLCGYPSFLCTTALPPSEENQYFYHNVENIKYYPLRNDSLKTIQIEIVDAANRRLALKAGQPSIVQFHLRKKRRNMPFSLTHLQIDSEMDDKITAQHRNNDFEIHLKKPLHLNDGAKIALAEISFPNNILTVPKFVGKRKGIVYSDPLDQTIKAEPSADGGKLVTAMNQQLWPCFAQRMMFTSEVREDGSWCFGIKYTGAAEKTDMFTPSKLHVFFFHKKMVPVFGVNDRNVIIEKNAHYKATTAMKTEDLTKPGEIRITLEPFYGYFHVKEGTYTTPAELVDCINENMDESLKKVIEFYYENDLIKVRRTILYYPILIRFEFFDEMKKILGINLNRDEYRTHGGYFVGDYPPDMYGLYPGVMVCYASFIKHSIIASEFYPIFRLIPVRRDEQGSKYVSVSFNNLEFIKCNTSRLDILRFELKRLDGEFIDFADNKKIIMSLVVQNPK